MLGLSGLGEVRVCSLGGGGGGGGGFRSSGSSHKEFGASGVARAAAFLMALEALDPL